MTLAIDGRNGWAMIGQVQHHFQGENGGGAMTYKVEPKQAQDGAPQGDLLEVSMGPHHPSTHGVFRMDVVLDGETVVKLKPVFGYLHRNHEKIGENTTYLGSMPYTDRLDYFCSMTNNWAYALRSEERRVGKECRYRWAQYHLERKNQISVRRMYL